MHEVWLSLFVAAVASLQDEDMGLTGSLLGGSMARLGKITGAKSSSTVMCYLVGFCVVVFIVIWYLIR